MSHRDSHDVIVIGAGASGLAAATALHAAGRDMLCLEARDRIGGRLLSVPAPSPERALDLGATWFWDGEEHVRELAAGSGIETFAQHLAGDTMLQDATGTRRLTGNLIDAPSRRFAAGAQSLTSALAATLPEDALRLRTPITAVHPHGQGGLVLHTPTGTLRAEHVVLALPPALALERIDFGDVLPTDLVRLARTPLRPPSSTSPTIPSSHTPSTSGRRSTADCTGRRRRRRPIMPATSKAPVPPVSERHGPCSRRAPERTSPAAASAPRAGPRLVVLC